MKCRGWPIVVALALASCAEEPPQEARDQSSETGGPTDTRWEVDATDLAKMGPERHILAFGDSLFAGYGVGEENGYPATLQQALRAQGINAVVTNAGVSGDTTAAGLQRIEFVLDGLAETPDLAIVELGGNDLLRGISPEETRANLSAILEEIGERNVPVLLMGMRAPPNLGEAFVEDYDALYPELAGQYDAALVPFFLAPVYDKPELIQPDRVHPTAQGIEALVAATVDEVAAALPDEN